MTHHVVEQRASRVRRRAPFLAAALLGWAAGAGAQTTPSAVTFENETAAAGFLSIQGYGGHGIQVADIDDDGLLDVYVTHIFDPKENRPDLLFRNLGGTPQRFEEIGIVAGVDDDGFFPLTLEDGTVEEFSEESHAAVFADFDNDGDLDLFNGHTWSGHHRLYRNDGGARFVDISDSAGIDVRDLGPRGVAAADLDGNGLLDIIVTAWQGYIPNVYMNRGGMRFERERLKGDAIPEFANQGLSVVDLTGDSRPDIALSAFEFVAGPGGGPVAILANEYPRFAERTGFSGLEYPQETSDFRGTNGFSFQDIDGDADLDVVITGFHGSRLYRNNGEGRFNLVRRFEGQHYTAAFGDVDNDGDLDLYFAGDASVFLNDGGGGFSRLTGIGLTGVGMDARSAVFADMDNDGDLDLLIASKQGPNTFFRNTSPSAGGWLAVALTGPNGERGAVGAEVTVSQGGRVVGHQVVQSSTGYCSQDAARLHFGLGTGGGTYDVRVKFRGGSVVNRTGVTAGKVVRIGGGGS